MKPGADYRDFALSSVYVLLVFGSFSPIVPVGETPPVTTCHCAVFSRET